MPDQRSVTSQMADVRTWAVEQGMYDAADWIERAFFRIGMESPSWGGSMTCGTCGKTWDVGSHIIGSTTHVCPAQFDGRGDAPKA